MSEEIKKETTTEEKKGGWKKPGFLIAMNRKFILFKPGNAEDNVMTAEEAKVILDRIKEILLTAKAEVVEIGHTMVKSNFATFEAVHTDMMDEIFKNPMPIDEIIEMNNRRKPLFDPIPFVNSGSAKNFNFMPNNDPYTNPHLAKAMGFDPYGNDLYGMPYTISSPMGLHPLPKDGLPVNTVFDGRTGMIRPSGKPNDWMSVEEYKEKYLKDTDKDNNAIKKKLDELSKNGKNPFSSEGINYDAAKEE